MYYIGRVDVLMSWVPIVVVVFVFLTASVLFPIFRGGISLSGPLCVDAFEDMVFFHHVVGLGMELAPSFQRLVVVFLEVPPSIGTLDCVYLVIAVARSLASEIVTIVAAPVPPFSWLRLSPRRGFWMSKRPWLSSHRGGCSAPRTSSWMSFFASSASA